MLVTGLCSNKGFGGQRIVEKQRPQKFREACVTGYSITFQAGISFNHREGEK